MKPPLRPRIVARIARWEVLKGAGTVDRRSVAVLVVALLAVVPVGVLAASGGVALDEGIYRVGIEPSSPYYEVAEADPTFRVAGTGAGALAGGLHPDEGYDLVVEGRRITLASDDDGFTAKSRAALAALRESVGSFNDARMRLEGNRTAAAPVTVTLRYTERERVREVVARRAGDGVGDDASGGGRGGSGDGPHGGPTSDDADASRGDPSSDGGFGAPSLGDDLFGTGTSTGAPSDIAPPFPFQSLVLAFAFVVPLNFVVQAYSSSILRERIKRRGELLLVAPVAPREIVAGKTLPYFLGALAIATGITLVVGGGPLSVLAVVPLALLFLGASFVGAMFARSFKELTFVTVSVSVFLTTFAFVPAIFTDIDSVALISPLTLVVRDLTGAPVSAGDVAFATLPTTLAALVLFALGTGVYREEDMFTQRPVHLKALDALAGRISRPRSLVLVTALLVPFVFVAELLAVAVLYPAPRGLAVPLVLVAVAVVEEFAKSAPVLAGFVNARYSRDYRTALVAGAASGLGFFLAEKFTLVAQLVGLPNQDVGSAAIGVGPGVSPLVLVALLVAPLALHVVTAAISALGAARDTEWWLVGVGTAVLVHVAYNLTVVTQLV
ncbi:PrsW family intramembrane metalloprotease [Salinirubellus salinus]|uniref:PrsW family intramembrane metalloprotease n=1 Tax=Salinirubellus salinus TaxID=1364945 RepID=A0A9E7R5E0_9EURY|nr:PrsW family intramembrane metalloprotease [Salinirubellus salinus]UWM55882.1 PrsW family intramembrane metalloprotease [Salinirubellus salinus]